MLLITAAALASALPLDATDSSARPVVQAHAVVRIVSGARIRWDSTRRGDLPPARTTMIQTTEGLEPAKLIEFE